MDSSTPPPPVVVPPGTAVTGVTTAGPTYVSSTPGPGYAASGPGVPPPGAPKHVRETQITLVSHTNLFYCWPIWALAFMMALFTFLEGNRLAVVPSGTRLTEAKDARPINGVNYTEYTMQVPEARKTNSLISATAAFTEFNAEQNLQDNPIFKPRISGQSWPGGIFIVGLVLTIVVTNVPLRGLVSFLFIILLVAASLLLALLNLWDRVFELLGNLHIHINMAGYLTLGIVMFIAWALTTFVFDPQTYVVFTPGQVKVCEHIGDSVQAFNSNTVVLEKKRDDLFRHYIFGLGSGDLIIKVGGGVNRNEIRMPNVLFLGSRLPRVEEMTRTVATVEQS